MKQHPRHGRPHRRAVRFTAVYALILVVGVIFALTADFGLSTGVARDSVEVALLPAQVAPLVEAALGADAGTGTLTGTVLFDGNPPKYPPVVKAGDMSKKNPEVCAVVDVPDETLVINSQNKGIQNVFIYLAKSPAGAKPPKPDDSPVVFDQKGCRFIPHGLVVRVGQTVLVKSDDGIPHNTNTKPVRSDKFNQVIPPNDRMGVALKYNLAERAPIRVSCDYHDWMSAYHLALDHPYMAVTDENGKFTINDLPAGKHEFVIWHEKKDYLDRRYAVEIKANEKKEVTLKYGAAKFAATEAPKARTVAVNAVP